jgi:hypothetical protein
LVALTAIVFVCSDLLALQLGFDISILLIHYVAATFRSYARWKDWWNDAKFDTTRGCSNAVSVGASGVEVEVGRGRFTAEVSVVKRFLLLLISRFRPSPSGLGDEGWIELGFQWEDGSAPHRVQPRYLVKKRHCIHKVMNVGIYEPPLQKSRQVEEHKCGMDV